MEEAQSKFGTTIDLQLKGSILTDKHYIYYQKDDLKTNCGKNI
jgi:hypothetical protein